MDFNMGNPGAANVIEGAASGLKDAVQSIYQIQMAKAQMAQKFKEQDADIALKNAQADDAEAKGQISSIQADGMRDYINKQKKMNDAQGDIADTQISTVQDRIHKAAAGYHSMLTNAIQTPEGQDYMAQRTASQGNVGADGTPSNAPTAASATDPNAQAKGGSPVVNAIMPGVGDQEPQQTSNGMPPMSMASGGTNVPTQPAQAPQQPSVQAPVDVSRGTSQATNQNNEQLPPLSQVYNGLSRAPFGESQSDIYMKNPNVMSALKSGQYMIKKDPAMIQAENPLSLNENDRTVLNDVPDLKKAGYDPKDIFQQLTPGTQTLINTVGQYKATPAELTSSFGGGRQKQELVKAVQSFYPGWNDAIYDQRHKALVDFTDPNGKNGQAIVSTRQGIQHMDELTQSIDAVSNKTMPGNYGRQTPVLNMPLNAIQQYVGGDPDILALKQNINAVSEEMTKAWGGSNAGESRLKNWRDTMSATNSPQGWSGLLSKTAKLWQAAADTRESMFGLAMGGQKMEDVLGQGVLEPQQQAILDRIKGGYAPGHGNSKNNNANVDSNAFTQKARAAGYNDQQIQAYLAGRK